MTHFTIVIPTIRDHRQVAPAIMRCWETCTHPTDLLVLHGDRGKSNTLNAALAQIADGAPYPEDSYLVLADDDFVFPAYWQDKVSQAFKDLPSLGIAGLCFPRTAKYESYMAQWPQFRVAGKTSYQQITHGNVVGACMIMPKNVAIKIGPHPVAADISYSYDDDGHKCFRARQLGFGCAYIKCTTDAEIVDYADTPEYLKMKAHDIALTKERGLTWLPTK